MDLMIHDFDYVVGLQGMWKVSLPNTAANPNAPVDYGLAILKHRGAALALSVRGHHRHFVLA
jgi:hypothetical protein